MTRKQLRAALALLAKLTREFIARGNMPRIHECEECAHVMPSQRRDWHNGRRRWYTMIGEGRSWE